MTTPAAFGPPGEQETKIVRYSNWRQAIDAAVRRHMVASASNATLLRRAGNAAGK